MATTPAQLITFTNQGRDSIDLGLWDADGPLPPVTSGLKADARAKLKARRAAAHHLFLGSQDDREHPQAVTADRWEPGQILSPRSQPIPLDVAKVIIEKSPVLRGLIKQSPQAVSWSQQSDADLTALGV